MSSFRRPICTLLLLAFSTVVVSSGPAGAHLAERNDPNDPGPLDIRHMTFQHRDGFVTTSLTTDGDWTQATLAGNNTIAFQWDSRGGRFADYIAVVDRTSGGELRARLYKWHDAKPGPPAPSATLEGPINDVVKRDRTVKIKFAKSRLNPDKDAWGWMGQTYYTSEGGSCSEQCYDVAPDEFMFPHQMG